MTTFTRDQIEKYLENAFKRKENVEDRIFDHEGQLKHYKESLEELECEIRALKDYLKTKI